MTGRIISIQDQHSHIIYGICVHSHSPRGVVIRMHYVENDKSQSLYRSRNFVSHILSAIACITLLLCCITLCYDT